MEAEVNSTKTEEDDEPSSARVIKALAKGAYGDVYLVRVDGEEKVWKEFRKNVDKKILNREFSIPVQRKLDHENIMSFQLRCVAYQVGDQIEEFTVLEMEPAGESLQDTIDGAKDRNLTEILVTKTFLNILNAITCAHSKNVMHRDLKPSNILMFFDKNEPGAKIFQCAKVTDFGMCRVFAGEEKLMSTDVGTIGYKAPEIESGSYGYPVDIYSCGKILEALLEHLEDCPGKPKLTKLAQWMTVTEPQYRAELFWALQALEGKLELTDDMIAHIIKLGKEEKLRVLKERVVRLEEDIAASQKPLPSSGSSEGLSMASPVQRTLPGQIDQRIPTYLAPFLSTPTLSSSVPPPVSATPSLPNISSSQQ